MYDVITKPIANELQSGKDFANLQISIPHNDEKIAKLPFKIAFKTLSLSSNRIYITFKSTPSIMLFIYQLKYS